MLTGPVLRSVAAVVVGVTAEENDQDLQTLFQMVRETPITIRPHEISTGPFSGTMVYRR